MNELLFQEFKLFFFYEYFWFVFFYILIFLARRCYFIKKGWFSS